MSSSSLAIASGRLAALALTLLVAGTLVAGQVRGAAVQLRPWTVAAPFAATEAGGNGPCRRLRREAGVTVCDFGVAPAQATRTVALVGDSHASHWRAALDAVAGRQRWRGLSITHTSCPFSRATKLTPEPTRSGCVRWVGALPGYLARHPEVDTVFAVGITGGKVHVPPGLTRFQAKVEGFRRAWQTLPASVEHIVVIRDTPKMTRRTAGCIDRAQARHKVARLSCAVPRHTALEADPQVAAALQERARHVQVVDLTARLCNSRRCFPVIDGVVVYRDIHHITPAFSRSLGAPLERAVEQAMVAW